MRCIRRLSREPTPDTELENRTHSEHGGGESVPHDPNGVGQVQNRTTRVLTPDVPPLVLPSKGRVLRERLDLYTKDKSEYWDGPPFYTWLFTGLRPVSVKKGKPVPLPFCRCTLTKVGDSSVRFFIKSLIFFTSKKFLTDTS